MSISKILSPHQTSASHVAVKQPSTVGAASDWKVHPITRTLVTSVDDGSFKIKVIGANMNTTNNIMVASPAGFTVDWGDNSPVEEFSSNYSGNVGHMFPDPDMVYTVTFKDIQPTVGFVVFNMENTLVDYLSPLPAGWCDTNNWNSSKYLWWTPNYMMTYVTGIHARNFFKHFKEATTLGGSAVFGHANRLTYIAPDMFKGMSALTDISLLFADGYYGPNQPTSTTALDELVIPPGLFDDCVSLTTVESVFQGPTRIRSIPYMLFHPSKQPNINNFARAFTTGFAYNCPYDNYAAAEADGFAWQGFIRGEAPPLWEWYPNAEGSNCFSDQYALDNYQEIPQEWGGPHE